MGMRVGEAGGQVDAVWARGMTHPDLGENDARSLALNRDFEGATIRAHCDELHAVVNTEHLHQALARRVRALRNCNRDRATGDGHRASVFHHEPMAALLGWGSNRSRQMSSAT